MAVSSRCKAFVRRLFPGAPRFFGASRQLDRRFDSSPDGHLIGFARESV